MQLLTSVPATEIPHTALQSLRASDGQRAVDACNAPGRNRSVHVRLAGVLLVMFSSCGHVLCAQDVARVTQPRVDVSQAPATSGAMGTASAPAADSGRIGQTDPLPIPDEEIRVMVETALQASGITFEDLVVRVNQGIVTLQGAVKSRQAKRRLSRLVQQTRGVVAVVNEIEVQPRFSVVPIRQ
jgi:hypothetical protein